MASMETEIFANLKTRLEELTWVNLVDYERVRLTSGDFMEHELPAIQMYDNGQDVRHEQRRVIKLWNIVIELVMKSSSSDEVTQSVLLDRKHDVELKIGEYVQLDLGSAPQSLGTISHMKMLSAITDLHLLQPFYLVTFTFQVEFRSPFTGEC